MRAGEDFGERDKKGRMEDKGKEEREQREGIRQSTSCSLVPRPSHGKRERVWEISIYACVAEEFMECNFVNREALSARKRRNHVTNGRVNCSL